MRVKRAFLFLGATILVVSASGYAVAFLGVSSCEGIVRTEVQNKGVTGLAFSGEVILTDAIEVYSHVDLPFVVTAGYAVPFDLHVTYHETQFLVMPWHVYKLSGHRLMPV